MDLLKERINIRFVQNIKDIVYDLNYKRILLYILKIIYNTLLINRKVYTVLVKIYCIKNINTNEDDLSTSRRARVYTLYIIYTMLNIPYTTVYKYRDLDFVGFLDKKRTVKTAVLVPHGRSAV